MKMIRFKIRSCVFMVVATALHRRVAGNASPEWGDYKDRNLLAIPTRSAGFTLVELMAVIAIMSILITIGAVSLPRMSKSLAVTRGTQMVINAMEFARQTAITYRAPARVIFKPRSHGQVSSMMVGVYVSNQNLYASSYALGASNTWIVPSAYGAYLGHAGEQSKIILPQGATVLWKEDVPGSVYRFPRQNKAGKNFGLVGPPGGPPGGYPMLIMQKESVNLTYTPSSGPPNNFESYGSRLVTTGPWGDDWQGEPHAWIAFDRFGRADVTATVTVIEVSSRTGTADTNSANRAMIITQAGSSRIRVVR